MTTGSLGVVVASQQWPIQEHGWRHTAGDWFQTCCHAWPHKTPTGREHLPGFCLNRGYNTHDAISQDEIDAAKAAGVGQFVFVAGSSYNPNSRIPYIAGRSQTEDYLRASGMRYTIMAPTAFGEVWLKEMIVTPVLHGAPVTVVDGDPGKIAFISVSDVASFIVASIGHPAAINQHLLLAGPQAISFSEATHMFGELINREIPIVSVNPGEHVPFVSEAAQPLLIGLSLHGDAAPANDLARTFGVELTPPAVILQRMATPQPY